jgi:hypothetical protein
VKTTTGVARRRESPLIVVSVPSPPSPGMFEVQQQDARERRGAGSCVAARPAEVLERFLAV